MNTVIVLVVAFFVDGEWKVRTDLMPRVQPSIEICEHRAQQIQEYLLTMEDLPRHESTCLTTDGTPESGRQAFEEWTQEIPLGDPV